MAIGSSGCLQAIELPRLISLLSQILVVFTAGEYSLRVMRKKRPSRLEGRRGVSTSSASGDIEWIVSG